MITATRWSFIVFFVDSPQNAHPITPYTVLYFSEGMNAAESHLFSQQALLFIALQFPRNQNEIRLFIPNLLHFPGKAVLIFYRVITGKITMRV